ncbi:protein lplB [Spirochaetia bacterium]|nr:protein lplB [Spirochaetia bacterium]
MAGGKPFFKQNEIPLHLMLLPGLLLTFIFGYLPLAGLTVAFQRFIPARGLFGKQPWVGLYNFELIFSMPNTPNVIRNTVVIAFGKIVLGLLIPIIVTLLLNELGSNKAKRTIQTIIYFPYFISWIVFAALLLDLLSPSTGLVNKFTGFFGFEPIFFLGDNRYFQGTMIITDVIKSFGYGTVVYMAAITGIDPNLYEAAEIDGAGRWRQTLHITLPGLQMVIVLMMVLSLGNVLNAGFDQIFNMYNSYVYETGDIIDTMMYRLGIVEAMYGPSTAMGFLKSIVSLVFISTSYYIAYKLFDYRIF